MNIRLTDRPAIEICNARHHNLKGIDISIPLHTLTVITGPSGSGKSTLAMDILFSEGRRRYLESLGPDSRPGITLWNRPLVDGVAGLPPPVALEQCFRARNPKSSVATITDVGELLRVLFAAGGVINCPICGVETRPLGIDEMVEAVIGLPSGSKFLVLAPIPCPDTDLERRNLAKRLGKEGFHRIRIGGETVGPDALDSCMTAGGSMELVVDRLIIREGLRPRVVDSLAIALRIGSGKAIVEVLAYPPRRMTFSETAACVNCNLSFPPLSPRLFSPYHPDGMCPACRGTGDGCHECEGTGLNSIARGVRLGGKKFLDLMKAGIDTLRDFLLSFAHDGRTSVTAARIAHAIHFRLVPISSMGLGYLSLDRPVVTLSGGEVQRLRIASQLGRDLTGILYILDEPCIGLHPVEKEKLYAEMLRLKNQGNTVLVIEHDLSVIERADHVIELGPGAGTEGGGLIHSGPPGELHSSWESVTGPWLSQSRSFMRTKRTPRGWMILKDARARNLKNLEVAFPLGCLAAVTGVSGSGKSTLVFEELAPSIAESGKVHGKVTFELPAGIIPPSSVVAMDQAPLLGTRHSMPVTYLGAFTQIRTLYARTPEGRSRGVTSSYFSLAGKGGRCERCEGRGTLLTDLGYLPPASSPCDVCGGRRYQRDALEIRFKGLSIADVLDLPAHDAAEFFARIPHIRRPFETMERAGIGYIPVGQPVTTLSGGEAQRMKLARHLLAERKGPSLFLFDEVSRGLHPVDIERILGLVEELIEQGNSVILIEHKPEILAISDWILELGPGGGPAGGTVIASGTPEEVTRCPDSRIGPFISRHPGRA